MAAADAVEDVDVELHCIHNKLMPLVTLALNASFPRRVDLAIERARALTTETRLAVVGIVIGLKSPEHEALWDAGTIGKPVIRHGITQIPTEADADSPDKYVVYTGEWIFRPVGAIGRASSSVAIPGQDYAGMQAKLAACGKPKHFRTTLTDRAGVRSTILYDPVRACFYEKNSRRVVLNVDALVQDANGQVVAHSTLGAAMLTCDPVKQAQAMQEHNAAYATGNHVPREERHKVSVPYGSTGVHV
jgi:hypothetical protein